MRRNKRQLSEAEAVEMLKTGGIGHMAGRQAIEMVQGKQMRCDMAVPSRDIMYG